MEPTVSQIKEYVREKNIDVFQVLNIDTSKDSGNFLFGDNQNEVYYQYYLEHSIEIGEWLSNNILSEERRIEFWYYRFTYNIFFYSKYLYKFDKVKYNNIEGRKIRRYIYEHSYSKTC
mgnify:FL=1